MLRPYRSCNSTVGFSKYYFNNKLLGSITLFRITPGVTLIQLSYIYIYIYIYLYISLVHWLDSTYSKIIGGLCMLNPIRDPVILLRFKLFCVHHNKHFVYN